MKTGKPSIAEEFAELKAKAVNRPAFAFNAAVTDSGKLSLAASTLSTERALELAHWILATFSRVYNQGDEND